MDVTSFFKLMVDKGASDLFFSVGAPPNIKIEGKIEPIGQVPLKTQQMIEIVASLMSDQQRKELEEHLELNIPLSIGGVGRFRINIFRQRGTLSMVVRYIKSTIPTLEDLGLPTVLQSIITELRGLVLVVGATGSGKSTTLASLVDHRNRYHSGHILTIEDPIEFMHDHKQCIVNQREVGIDTLSYDNALKNAMREAPDVILIGEIRDINAMKHALSYSETGHLCISTLHANNANQAIDRIINFFPDEARKQVLLDLSLNLKAIISLRLVPGISSFRTAAVEVLLNSPYIADLIEKGKVDEIKAVMERSNELGMQTFDQALYTLYEKGLISQENAIKFADSQNNVGLKIRLKGSNNIDLLPDELSLKAEDK